MKLGYDNIDDARTKLLGTFCMYKGRAVSVEILNYKDGSVAADNKYVVAGTFLGKKEKLPWTDIDDPEFNCSNYNIGYVNSRNCSVWFYRQPGKQYSQGLKASQINRKASHYGYDIDFKHGAPLAQMLENSYSSFTKCVSYLLAGPAEIIAFNKNFAVSLDKIHSDFIIEYKGDKIGYTRNLKDFILMDEHKHLIESLKEAVA